MSPLQANTDKVSADSVKDGIADPHFARELLKEIRGHLPVEKAMQHLRQIEIAKALQAAGSVRSNGLGQKLGSISSRMFFRWMHDQQLKGNGNPWKDPGFINEFMADNPHCKAPGWKPKANSIRHAKTSVTLDTR